MDENADGLDATEALWSALTPGWEGVTGSVARSADAAREIPGVPRAWIDLVGNGERIALAAEQWRDMPRFARYLRSSTLDVGVGLGVGGPVLVYLLSDWVDVPTGGFLPGLMIGGLPTPPEALASFEERVGEIPAALRGAWRAHGFVLLKNGRWLGTLVPGGERITRPPALVPRPSRGWAGQEEGRFECLEVLDPDRSITGCLVRRPGERAWLDYIVYRDGSGRVHSNHRPTIESTFTDWDTSEFEG